MILRIWLASAAFWGAVLVAHADRCPNNWAEVDSNCYFVSTMVHKYVDAEQSCNEREAKLASLADDRAFDVIGTLVKSQKQNYWVGLSRDDGAGSGGWKWDDGSTPVPPAERWFENTIPEAGTFNCAQVRWNEPSFQNQNCNNHRNYICKRDINVIDKCDYANDWHPFSRKCFKYMTTDASWPDARTTCMDARGDLAVLDDDAKLGIFTEVVNCKDFLTDIWMGLSDQGQTAHSLHWVNGVILTSPTDWDDHQPIFKAGINNCVAATTTRSYKWRVDECDTMNKFVCERNEGTCADGWETYPDSSYCYLLVSDPEQQLTWIDALNRCRQYGGGGGGTGSLIQARNEREHTTMKLIASEMSAAGNTRYRMGASDYDADGIFTWDDKSHISYTTPWEEGQPVNVPDSWDCGYVNAENAEATWLTLYCFSKMPYVCQLPIHSAPFDIEDPPVYTCPDGWLNYGTKCYYFSNDVTNHATARAECADLEERSHLAIIYSAEEQSFISGKLRGNSWFDLVYKNGDWEWEETNDKPFFLNWATDGKDSGKACVRMKETAAYDVGAWVSADCTDRHEYVCQMGAEGVETVPTQAQTPAWSPYCGPGWSYDASGHHCYKLRYDELVTYEMAEQRCRDDDDSHLASISTLAEQTFINALVHNTVGGAELYWIGLNDRDLSKGWQWTDGNAVGFFFWNQGEPNNWDGDEWCVEIAPKWDDRWNDHRCEALRGFVCKKPSTRFTTPQAPATTVGAPTTCEDGGQPLVSGEHYLQDEYMRSYYYSADQGTRQGISEPKREPWNARLDKQNSGSVDEVCPNHATDGVEVDGMYTYKDVVPVTGWDYAVVEVMACDEVHVAFADGTDILNAALYEWIVGGWENTRVAVRKCVHPCEEYTYTSTPQLLDCNEYRVFWFTWKDGNIQMGYGRIPNSNRIFVLKDESALVNVQHMGLTTAWGRIGKWCVPQELAAGSAGAWTPYPSDAWEQKPQELELFLLGKYVLVSITTQGAHARNEWLTAYSLSYRLTEASQWYYVYNDGSEVFPGNTDQGTKVVKTFDNPVIATYLRIRPVTFQGKPSLRLEVNGCVYTGDTCPLEEQLKVNIPNDQFTSSGFRDNYEPYHARFESQTGWIAASPSTPEADFIQVEFDRLTDVHAILTKGHGEVAYWVQKYKFRYARSCWLYDVYQEPYGTDKVFSGNMDQITVVEHMLKAPIRVTCVRIYPQEWNGDSIGMRLEFKTATCPAGCNPQELISGENHRIEDLALTASSSWTPPSVHGPHASRLHLPQSDVNAGAWCAGKQEPGNEWIQADLGYALRIYAVATQGRDSPAVQYVMSYFLAHSSSATGDAFTEYHLDNQRKVFEANFERHLVRKHYLRDWFVAHRVRLYPLTWTNHMSLRWELYGCPGGAWARRDIGCYADVSDPRDLPNAFLKNPVGGLTKDLCAAHCFDQGYEYAGAQHGNECYCGNSYGLYGPSNICVMYCPGNPSTSPSNICGGRYANSIMSTGLAPSFSRCADGYMEYNDACWRFVTETTASWPEARIACKYDGGDLATIRDQNEMDFVNSQIPLCCEDKWLWIGLHALQNSYYFEWGNSEAVTYTNWARREPNSFGGEEDCVHIYPYDGTWNDESCNVFRFNYICQKGKEALPTATPTEADPSCPQGWVGYRWKCFTLSKNTGSWSNKRDACQQFDGTLVRIEDSAEQAFVQSHVAAQETYFWTDLNDRDNYGSFMYTNGMAPAFTHWAANQPDTTDAATCAALLGSDLGLWYDEPCDERAYGAVCEVARAGETRPTALPTLPSGDCASGWKPYGNDCYLLNEAVATERRTFDDAELACVNMGAHLVSIHDASENLFLYEKINIISSAFWLGASRSSDGGWQWTDGSGFSYANWATDQPEDDAGKSCVYISHDNGQWAVSPCAAHMNWICKIASGVDPVSTVTPTYPTPNTDPNACAEDDSRWKFFEDKCYFFSGTAESPDDPPAATWYDAENWCKQNGGFLTSVDDDNTNMFLAGQVKDVQAVDVWIGLNELGGGGFNWWSDGSAASYYNWAEGSPDDNGGQMCVTMLGRYDTVGTWRNQHCLELYPFVCAKTKGGVTVSTVQPTVRPGGCPDNYRMYENKCFRFMDEEVEWSAAQSQCRAAGSGYNLASVSNVWEQSFLTEMLSTSRRSYWLGMKMLDVSKTFGWVDNTPVEYVNWAKGEPNGGDSEQCVEMWPEPHHAGQWNDASCQSGRAYICMTLRDVALPTPQPPSNGRCSELTDGSKWYLWNDDCYRILTDMDRSWQAAEDRCAQDDGHLASVLSPYENAFIHAYAGWLHAEFHRSWNLWIGLSDTENPGRYVWSDHWSPVYINWGEGQPDITDGACAQMEFIHGAWEALDCSYQMWSLCKHSNKDPTYTKPPLTGGCPMAGAGEDWLDYGDYCYLFKAEEKNFAEARMECRYRSGELASIHSDEENDFIMYHTQGLNGFNSWWWIGLYKTESGTLVWADDTGSNFLNWNEGEPSDIDGSQGENCVEFYTFNGKWNDMTCQTSNGFVCMARKSEVTNAPTDGPGVSPGVSTMSTAWITGTTGSVPSNGPSTDGPQLPGAPGSGSGGMSPGGVVGLVFFLMFLCLAAIVTVLFVMRRQGRPIPYIDQAPHGAGIENPIYVAHSNAQD